MNIVDAWRATTVPRWMIFGEWRAHPLRILTAIVAIVVGVALGFAVHLVNASALDRFAEFLKIPAVTVLLVVIGFTGLILELKVPGTTVPGIVSALCFILVFWAHTQFSGQIAVLAGLLFVLGLILILLEVFVLPGIGAAGICGVIFMLAALGLMTFNEIPDTTDGWVKFGGRIATSQGRILDGAGKLIAHGEFAPRPAKSSSSGVEIHGRTEKQTGSAAQH